MMESDFMFCVYLTFLAVLYIVSAWFLLRPQVKAIPESDSEDRELFEVACDPDTLHDILSDVNHPFVTIRQIDAVIQALHKHGYVVMGPSREEITEAAAMYQDRSVLS